jgi:hypothetical protein
MDTINEARLRVWAQQPAEFFAEAVVEADGSIVPSDAVCKRGIDFAYNGQYGYHPLLISLANTAEPLFLFNRIALGPMEPAVIFFRACRVPRHRAGPRQPLGLLSSLGLHRRRALPPRTGCRIQFLPYSLGLFTSFRWHSASASRRPW